MLAYSGPDALPPETGREGIAQGVQQGMLAAIQALMASTGRGADESMEALAVPQEDRPRFRELLAGA